MLKTGSHTRQEMRQLAGELDEGLWVQKATGEIKGGSEASTRGPGDHYR